MVEFLKDALLRREEVQRLTGLGRQSLYDRLNPQSKYFDPDFPKQVAIGVHSVRWSASEIQGWIARKIEQSRKPS